MHIVFVCREYVPSLRGGGIASYIKETAVNLVKRGHTVTVCCASDDTREETEYSDQGVRVIRLSGGDFVIPGIEHASIMKKFRCLYRFFSYRKKILKTIETLHNVDIVEVPEFGAEAFYLTRLKIPVVIRLHTPTLLDRNNAGIKRLSIRNFYEYWVGWQELRILPKFQYVTSCSLSLKRWFETHVPKLKSNIEVIYNSIEIDAWRNEKDDKYTEGSILYAGTVAEGKGIGDLIEACRILRKQNMPVTLHIAGKMGTYANSLKKEVDEKGETWCVFLGNQPRDRLKDWYARSKVSCFPSWWEAMGIVCIEALLAGNIVVGSANGGMAEIIDDGKDGYLAPPHNPGKLAEYLRRALEENKVSVAQKRANAYKKIKENFSTDVILDSLEKYYLNVIEKNAASQDIMG